MLCPSVSVDHASVFASISPQDGGRYTFGSRLDIVCNYGYMTNNSKQVECLPTGDWADDIPQCTGWWEDIRGHPSVTYRFFWKMDPNPPLRNNNNVEPYTFVTLFSGKCATPHHHLRYVMLEWPLRIKLNAWISVEFLHQNANYCQA